MKYHREYDRITAPVLIIYDRPFFYPPDQDPETIKLYESIENDLISNWRINNINRIRSEFKNATIIEMSKGSHASLIFSSKDSLIKSISSFLFDKN